MDLLRQRDLRLLWAGETTSAVGSSISSVATPLVALQVLDAGVLAVTLLTAATWLPWLVIGLPAGAWVDRLPRRRVLVVCDAVSAALLLSVPLAHAADVLTVAQLLAVNTGLGVCTVFFRTAWVAYVPTVVPPRDLVPANALLHGSESAAQVAGPGLAGLLAGAFGAVSALFVDALTFVASAIALLRVRAVEVATTPVRRRLAAEVAEGTRLVLRDRYLRNLITHGAVSNLPLAGYGSLVVAFLVRDLDQGPAAVGFLVAVGSIGGVAGATAVGRLVARLGTARTLVVCKVGAGPCALLLPLAEAGPRLTLFVLGSALVAGGVVAGNVVSASFRQTYVPGHLLGRVTSAMQVVNLGTIPVGAVIAGTIASAFGIRAALWGLVTAYALSGLILMLGPLRGRRDLPAPLTV